MEICLIRVGRCPPHHREPKHAALRLCYLKAHELCFTQSQHLVPNPLWKQGRSVFPLYTSEAHALHEALTHSTAAGHHRYLGAQHVPSYAGEEQYQTLQQALGTPLLWRMGLQTVRENGREGHTPCCTSSEGQATAGGLRPVRVRGFAKATATGK